MGFRATPDWRRAANRIAANRAAEYVEMVALLTVRDVNGIEDEPIAVIDMDHGVFQFDTRRLCVLAIWPRGSEPMLTHIFEKGSPHAINGRRNRAVAAAQAIGITPFMVV
jgi:hypothetical protein